MSLFKRGQRISFSRDMWAHPLFPWTAVISLTLMVLTVGLIFWKLAPIGRELDVIPLHYNVYFGVDLLGRWYRVFLLPAMGLVLFAANALFARALWEKEHVLSFFFAVGTIVISTVIFLAVLLITLLNL